MIVNNIKDKTIIEEVLKQLNIDYISHKYFKEGYSSKVILLNDKYLIKQNKAKTLEGEVAFLSLNKGNLMQKILYIHPNYDYVVYEYIEGNTMSRVYNVEDTVEKLLKIVKNYKDYDESGYGYYDEKVTSWEEFLLDEVRYSSENVEKYINDKDFVLQCVNNISKCSFRKKLIHGDFGTHNFIEKDNFLVGVIDPQTVIGDPLYDILFMIVSNVDVLQKFKLEEIFCLIKEEKEKIYSMLVVVLFCRISRCLKYHKNDINIYMDYWKYLKNKKSTYLGI